MTTLRPAVERWARGVFCAATLLAAGCGPEPAAPQTPATPVPAATSAAAPTPAAGDPEQVAMAAEIATVLRRVSSTRRLQPTAPVVGERLSRGEVVELIKRKTERELPKGWLDAQGELLRAFGLIPVEYAFAAGIYELIEKNVAGFYDQHSKKMYLLDDLAGEEQETLSHELVHALQDQHFDLTAMLEYRAGESDRITAAHALCEGDAQSAMFELSVGSAFAISPLEMRLMMVASVALSESGAETPRVLQASLVAPYVDGFRFVQSLRRRGGWQAVDAAYRALPASTEQLLHLDKYDAREPIVLVAEPVPFGSGWQKRDADVFGEQGLRMILEQWATRSVAAEAAAGWGGDRYIVWKRDGEDGAVEHAAAWHITFDSQRDAGEAAAVIAAHLGRGCRERPQIGPLSWKRQGGAIALTAGPYRRAARSAKLTSASSCAQVRGWVDRILAAR